RGTASRRRRRVGRSERAVVPPGRRRGAARPDLLPRWRRGARQHRLPRPHLPIPRAHGRAERAARRLRHGARTRHSARRGGRAAATDPAPRPRSYELSKEGFSLPADTMGWYERPYTRSDEDRLDPRASPLLAEDLSGLPPAHVATAGFDPLRDEGEAYARRMADAGVTVSLRRHPAMVHPFVNAVGAAPLARAALSEAVGALRMGLAY